MATVKDQTDYALAYRKFQLSGQGRSLKQYCEDEGINYTKLMRYSRKAFWDEKAKVASTERPFVEVEMTDEQSDGKVQKANPSHSEIDGVGISYINVKFTSGLQISHKDVSVDEIVALLKIIGGVS